MPPVQRNEPYSAFNFIVSFDGIGAAGFQEVSGLTVETEVIEYRDGLERTNSVVKLPGLNKYGNLTLKRGLTGDLGLWNWMLATIDGRPQRSDGSLSLLNEEREEVLRWLIRRAWPCKYSGPGLVAGSSEVAIETLMIAHEGFRVDD